MIGVLCGLGMAVTAGLGSVLVARAARREDVLAWTTLLVTCQAALLGVALITTADPPSIDRATVAGLVCGVSFAAAAVTFSEALARGQVGAMTALVSLEGAVVAVMAAVTGTAVGVMLVAGVLLVTGGGLLVAAEPVALARSDGRALALTAAVAFGTSYFVGGASSVPALELLFVQFAVAAAVLVAVVVVRGSRGWRPPGSLGAMGGVALLGLSNSALYLTGARSGEAVATAVVGAQSAMVAALLALVWLGERPTRRGWLGVSIICLGVAMLGAS